MCNTNNTTELYIVCSPLLTWSLCKIDFQEFLPGGAARSIIDALLREANSNITCPKNAIDAAPDALRMMTALNSLSKAANDAQQRGWALHDDAHDIQTQLLELISVMVCICVFIIANTHSYPQSCPSVIIYILYIYYLVLMVKQNNMRITVWQWWFTNS